MKNLNPRIPRRTLIIGGAVLILGIFFISAAFAYANHTSKLKSSHSKTENTSTTKSDKPIAESKTEITPGNDAPSVPGAPDTAANLPAKQPQSTPPKGISLSPTSSRAQSAEVTTPLSVAKIFTLGARAYCDSGNAKLIIPQASVYMHGSQAGVLSWQVEETRGGNVSIGLSQSVSIPKDQSTYDLDSALRSYIFSSSGTGSGIRIHITSPNDITTPWYFINNYSGTYNCNA